MKKLFKSFAFTGNMFKNSYSSNLLNIPKIHGNNTFINFISCSFATKMRGTVTKNKKDSAGRRLGLKKMDGQEVFKNDILIRQRGFKYKPGENVHYGRDHTLVASKEGILKFTTIPWSNLKKVVVNVLEKEIPNRYVTAPIPFMYHPSLYPEESKNNFKGEKLEVKNSGKYFKENKLVKNRLEYTSMKENYLIGIGQGQGIGVDKANISQMNEVNKLNEDLISQNEIVQNLAMNSNLTLKNHRKNINNNYDLTQLINEHLERNYHDYISIKTKKITNMNHPVKKEKIKESKSNIQESNQTYEVEVNKKDEITQTNNSNNSNKTSVVAIDNKNIRNTVSKVKKQPTLKVDENDFLYNMDKSMMSSYLSMKGNLLKMYLNSDANVEEFSKKINIYSSEKFYKSKRKLLSKFKYLLNFEDTSKLLLTSSWKKLKLINDELRQIMNGIKIIKLHKENVSIFKKDLFNFDKGISKTYNTLRDLNIFKERKIRISSKYNFKKCINKCRSFFLYKFGFVLNNSVSISKEYSNLKMLLTKINGRLKFKLYNLNRLRSNIIRIRTKRNICIQKIVNMHKLIKRKDLKIIKDLKPKRSKVLKSNKSKKSFEEIRIKNFLERNGKMRIRRQVIKKNKELKAKAKAERELNKNGPKTKSNNSKVKLKNDDKKVKNGAEEVKKSKAIKSKSQGKAKMIGKKDKKTKKVKISLKKKDGHTMSGEKHKKSISKTKSKKSKTQRTKESQENVDKIVSQAKIENPQSNQDSVSLNKSKNLKI